MDAQRRELLESITPPAEGFAAMHKTLGCDEGCRWCDAECLELFPCCTHGDIDTDANGVCMTHDD